MATYAIGDIQGCYSALRTLLDRLCFDERADRLWLVGDLVNRGPDSLAVLRFIRSLGDAAQVVLGNHDLYLLMVAAGYRKRGKDDTLQAVLDASDRENLLDWLASRPLFWVEGGYAMVHAGVPPQWSVAKAKALAGEVEAALRGAARNEFLSNLQGNDPHQWQDTLKGRDRLRYIVNAMTRMRFCTADGRLEFAHKGPPDPAPPGFAPWFAHATAEQASHTIVCGHWSALGFRANRGLLALDTGCLWGGGLTAVRLEDGVRFQVPCEGGTGRPRNDD